MEQMLESLVDTISIYGVGVHMIIAVFFAIHAMRRGQQMYWLWILFVFPFLGSVVYFFAMYLPNTRMEHNMRSGVGGVARLLNPGKELREAKKMYDLTPSLRNQMRVAQALLLKGDVGAAAAEYDACLSRAPAVDLDVPLAAAYAKLANQQPDAAVNLLRGIRTKNPEFRVEDVTLLSAKALAANGNQDAARQQFEYVMTRYGQFDAKAAYAMWLLEQKDVAYAKQLKQELDQTIRLWPRHAKHLNRVQMKALKKAFAQVG
jgi:hypothetical protein